MIERKILSSTSSVCPECLAKVPAERVSYDDKVYLEKSCPQHGDFSALLWQGEPAWQEWVRPKIPTQPQVCYTEVSKGCPFDCGLCADHHQHTCTALLEVTQRCNLKCSFCFAAAGGHSIDPDLATIDRWYEQVLLASGTCNIQLSGGEPTLRDDLPAIIALGKAKGFNFVQLNTNGLRLARDTAYVQRLKEAGLDSVFLQFDGTEAEIYPILRGSAILEHKLAAIRNCARANIGVVLVPTLVPGVNTHNIGAIVKFALEQLPTVRGVHFQPVSYFGRYPKPPADADRITLPRVMREIESQTNGLIKAANLKPPGCENALCSFHGNFKVLPNGSLQALSNTCCSGEKAEEGARKTRSFVARQWSGPTKSPGSENAAQADQWDILLQNLKTHSFSVSAMAFQDAWNLDLARLQDCCIHVVSPAGKLIPFCAYNLTNSQGQGLYRQGG